MGSSKKKKSGVAAFARPRLDADLISLMRLVDGKKFHDVELAARRILNHRPNQPLATKALTFALIGLGRFEDALPILNHALAKGREDPELYNNRGIALSAFMRWDEAISDFMMSLRLAPNDFEVLKNLGVAYGRMHRWDDAVPHLLKAIEYHPGDYVDAISVLANALANGGRVDEAWVCFNELWLGQKEVRFLYELIATSLRCCDWKMLREQLAELRTLSDDFSVLLGNPFISLFCPGVDGGEQRRVASSYVRDFIPKRFLESEVVLPEPEPLEGRKLKIGYLSADFRVHPVGFIIPQIIEQHDRSRVELFAYSIGVDDQSEIRRRLVSAFDHFADMKNAGDRELVQRMRDDGVDILVDLQGWTASGHPEALTLRGAPIQVNWLGYAGTMGHGNLADYLIGDPVVTPLEHADRYTECLALLPGCYLPADTLQELPSPPSRELEGLPADAFVFCSFNNSYKFNPDVFDLWCSLLRQAENSCLWLSRPAGAAADRLKQEAASRGIDPERIIFASRVDSRLDHLARLQLADLALDPFPYNSHSTGVDVLWSGVLMVSYLGSTFPGRVGASLLRNVGLEDLIAQSLPEYEAIALSLYQDRTRLVELRKKLVAGRVNAPLFDIPRFVASLEKLYFAMWHDYANGKREAIAIN